MHRTLCRMPRHMYGNDLTLPGDRRPTRFGRSHRVVGRLCSDLSNERGLPATRLRAAPGNLPGLRRHLRPMCPGLRSPCGRGSHDETLRGDLPQVCRILYGDGRRACGLTGQRRVFSKERAVTEAPALSSNRQRVLHTHRDAGLNRERAVRRRDAPWPRHTYPGIRWLCRVAL